jgi:hypothetical protein
VDEQRPPLDGARQDYEALRRYALDGGAGPRGLGVALLMRHGMAVWIRAWSACTGPPPAARPRADDATLVMPDDVRREVTQLLVTMALDASRGEVQA